MAREVEMITAELHIKNMVSKSCVYLVREILKKFEDVKTEHVGLGKIKIQYPAKKIDLDKLEKALSNFGFHLVHDKNEQIIEQIKVASIELIHFAYNANSLIRNSDYLSEKLGMSYSKLSKIFSDNTNTTLEKYLIRLKIEKVKELVSYDEYTLSEIAYMMGYSSVQYLSNQFKQITGQSVSAYKKSDNKQRTPLEDLA